MCFLFFYFKLFPVFCDFLVAYTLPGEIKETILRSLKYLNYLNSALLHSMINCTEAGETLTVTLRSGPPFHTANFVKLVQYWAAWCITGMLLSAQVAHFLILHRDIGTQIVPYIARKTLRHTSWGSFGRHIYNVLSWGCIVPPSGLSKALQDGRITLLGAEYKLQARGGRFGWWHKC